VQAYFETPSQFQGGVFDFSFEYQKVWDPALMFISSAQYSQKLINFSIEKFLVFLYHLISELQRHQPIVPFKFHKDMLLRVMATYREDQTIRSTTPTPRGSSSGRPSRSSSPQQH
jgi:hypothetical protein